MRTPILITAGDKYGRLTVIREVEPKRSGKQVQRCVECQCECGVVKEYRLYTLRNGNTKSCGCFAEEVAGANLRTHGFSGLDEYGIWQGMLHRCRSEDAGGNKNYGVRGICVCGRWRSSFEYFYEDMGLRPSSKHSIDRKDNDGNYSCGHCEECLEKGWVANCRWATQKQQARNTRVNYLVEHDGETKCLSEWAERYGLSPSVLYTRLVKLGWTFEEAVSRRVHVRRNSDAFYLIPMKDRGPDWQREHKRREVIRIAQDRRELLEYGDSLARTHRVDAVEFKSRVDAALVEGWTRKGAIFLALQGLGVVS